MLILVDLPLFPLHVDLPLVGIYLLADVPWLILVDSG